MGRIPSNRYTNANPVVWHARAIRWPGYRAINASVPFSGNLSQVKSLRLVLIKPSHYDDDGYVIQWFRSSMPSNSLAAVYGLAMDCAARSVLGPQTDIIVDAYDETNTRIRPERIARDIKKAATGMVGLVGVQS